MLTDEGRRLVDEARTGYGPTESDRRRVQSALAARLAAAGAAAALSSGGSASGSGLLSGFTASKGAVLAVIAGVAIGATSVGYLGSRRQAAAPASHAAPNGAIVHDHSAAARTPAVGREPPRLPVASVEAGLERPRPTRDPSTRSGPSSLRGANARATGPLASTPAPGPDVAGEVVLLARAQKALADGDLRRSLQLLERHERDFPGGILTEERAAARIIALCGLGQIATARHEIVAFLAKAPSSPLAERVNHACGAAWPSAAPPVR